MFYVVLHGIISGGFTSKSSSCPRQFDPPRPAPFCREFGAKQPRSQISSRCSGLYLFSTEDLPVLWTTTQNKAPSRNLSATSLCPFFETTTTPPPLTSSLPIHHYNQPTGNHLPSSLLRFWITSILYYYLFELLLLDFNPLSASTEQNCSLFASLQY